MVRMNSFFFCIIILCYLHTGSSVICYSCSASVGHGAACENITDYSQRISHHECSYADAVCAKYRIAHDNDTVIFRSCKNSDICFNLARKYDGQLLECQTCDDSELCNTASENQPWVSLVKSSIAILIMSVSYM